MYKEVIDLLSYNNSKIKKEFFDIQKNKIILYGAGSLGHMALDLLNQIGVRPKYIVDKNYTGQIDGIKVISPKEIDKKEKEEYTFLITISSISYIPIYNYLKNELKCKFVRQFYDYCEVYMKDILGNGWFCPDLSEKEKNKINLILEKLSHDENSFRHYLQFLWWKINRIEKNDNRFPILSNKKYFNAPCFKKFNENENFLDCGAHFGHTIKSFREITNNKFEKIWAIEPDTKNFDILNENIDLDERIILNKIALSSIDNKSKFMDNLGFASKLSSDGDNKITVKKIDSLKINPTIIKLHLEGEELNTLIGAMKTITNHRPILMVLADHNEDGLWKIAELLISLEKYTLYFYLHDYCGNSAIFYALPEERLND